MDRECTRCGESKPVSYAFYRHKITGRYDNYCRDCKNKQSRIRHRERYWNDERYMRKQKLKNKKIGGVKMTAEHFNEFVDTIRLTVKGMSLSDIADILNVAPSTLYNWRTRGVPKKETERVGKVLRTYIKEVM